MKSAPGTIQRTARLRSVFIDIILLLLTKTDKHIKNSPTPESGGLEKIN